MAEDVTTRIATSTATSITFRGHDLVTEVMGSRGFVEVLYFHVTERWPTAGQKSVLDACLVTLMEHGLTPSAIVSRILADNVPDEPQVAIAAGLLAVGNVFVGTMEGAADILAAGVGQADPEAYCSDVARRHREEKRPLPGFGHPIHKPDDPRSPRLFAIAEEAGIAGAHIALLHRLSVAVDRTWGRHLTINVTGAIAAVLLDAGLPVGAMRAMAVVSRCAGLVGHLLEERETHSGRRIWSLVEEGIAYQR